MAGFLVSAVTYMELVQGVRNADALIAASALSTGYTLLTANDRHYGFIDGVDVEVFRS